MTGVLVTVEETFGGPWGIVAERRSEIEAGGYGAFDRIYKEQVAANFLPITTVAEMLGCHESTARKRLRAAKARYIVKGLAHCYFKPDVEAIAKATGEAV